MSLKLISDPNVTGFTFVSNSLMELEFEGVSGCERMIFIKVQFYLCEINKNFRLNWSILGVTFRDKTAGKAPILIT